MRAFSMIEIMVVGAVTGVIATTAVIITLRSVGENTLRAERDHVLDDLVRVRAAHVADGRDDPLVVCVDCVDGAGNAKTRSGLNTLAYYLADDPADLTHGRFLSSTTFEVDLTMVCAAGSSAPASAAIIDALGRSISAPGQPRDCKLKIAAVGSNVPEPRDNIVLAGDGRLMPSFAALIPQEPAHAQNLSSRTTPVPMDAGRFTGDATRAPALPLH